MRDKFLVCSYVEGKGFLVVSELYGTDKEQIMAREEIERDMVGKDSAEYLFVRDKAGGLILALRQTACLFIERGKMGSLHLCPREGIAL